MRGGARGSVFQTGLPFRQESEGLNFPVIARPSFGRGCNWRRKYMRAYRGAQVAAGAWATMVAAK